MKFVKGEWVNKNTMNVIKHYERKQNEYPSARKFRREFRRFFNRRFAERD